MSLLATSSQTKYNVSCDQVLFLFMIHFWGE